MGDLRRTTLKTEIVDGQLIVIGTCGGSSGIDTETAGFPRGAPVFAVEVCDDIDYGAEGDQRYAARRADYFAAGTRVVWDVDVLHEHAIHVYRANNPARAEVYRRGETADAEPAVPGWAFAVDDLLH